jgi:hypothetical protein
MSDRTKWTHLAKVRFTPEGSMIIRAHNGGGFWVQLVAGTEVPQNELDLQPRRRHDDE